MYKTSILVILVCGLVLVCTPYVSAQTTITTVETPAITTVQTIGVPHEVPGGFPEGRPAAVDLYIPPVSTVQGTVITGNAGNFYGGYYVAPGVTAPVIVAPSVVYPRTYRRRSRRIPGGRVYETIEDRGIITETETVLQ